MSNASRDTVAFSPTLNVDENRKRKNMFSNAEQAITSKHAIVSNSNCKTKRTNITAENWPRTASHRIRINVSSRSFNISESLNFDWIGFNQTNLGFSLQVWKAFG